MNFSRIKFIDYLCVAAFVSLLGVEFCEAEEDVIVWALQNTVPPVKPGESCQIRKIIAGSTQDVDSNSTTPAPVAPPSTGTTRASTTTTTTTPTTTRSDVNSGSSPSPGDTDSTGKLSRTEEQQTNSSSTSSEPQPEIIIIDPCMDEENRNFMECVLHYNPSITEDDPEWGQGTCQCYKDWNHELLSFKPAYNHSLDPETVGDWFIWSEKYGECVVRYNELCGPTDPETLPYRCEPYVKIDKGAKVTLEARCNKLGYDPRYRICSQTTTVLSMEPIKNENGTSGDAAGMGWTLEKGARAVFLALFLAFAS